MSREKPRIPNVSEHVRGVGTLVGIEEVPPEPQPPRIDYIFEVVSARCELRLNDDTLTSYEEMWDFEGPGAAVRAAIKAAKKRMKLIKVTPESELELVVVKKVERHRMGVNPRDTNFYDPQFQQFVYRDLTQQRNLPQPTEEDVWSSKDENENED